ncbi:MAG: hypothetical protein Fues2KO_22330 [Fuerstiella sp.]
MIVQHVETGWEVIFQPAHGLLAADIGRRLAGGLQCEYWFETLTAINRHDDSKVAFRSKQRTYVTEAGAPRNFDQVSMSDQQRFEEVHNRLENAYRKHRWIGLLESQHADFLYAGSDVSKDLKQLLKDEKQRRRRTLKELDSTSDQLQAAYEVFRWCDRLSLILSRGRLPEMGRRLEIMTFSDDTRSDIFQSDDGAVHVEPWPFEADAFDVSVEVHQLKQLAFDDDEELEMALRSAPTLVRSWRFQQQE